MVILLGGLDHSRPPDQWSNGYDSCALISMVVLRIIGSGLSILIIAIIPCIDVSENHYGEKTYVE
jgi:hypothetical protein